MIREPLPPQDALQDNLGPNPLLESLGARIAYADMASKLEYFPLHSVRLAGASAGHREDMLALRTQHFVPTTASQEIAAALQTLLREHYILRNPMNADVRRKLVEITQFADADDPSKLPWFPSYAAATISKGITGVGKSTIIGRYLSLLPYQVRDFGNGEIPGFMSAQQIVWMKVDMSADGSRGGFLLGILAEVDRLIGTDFHDQYSRAQLSIEKLIVRVGIILATRFCGLLIVDEIQAKNFSESVHMKDLATFFLRLLNFGIPVVLSGNPLGFDGLDPHSQLMRRLTAGGTFHLDPAPTPSEFDWSRSLVPGIWSFDVMPKPTTLCDTTRQTLFEYSGGINDFLVRLRAESQRLALRLGKEFVGLDHIEQAYWGPTMRENHNLIRGFATRSVSLIAGFKDIPVDHYAKLWGVQKDEPAMPAPSARSSGSPTPAPVASVNATAVNTPSVMPSVVQKEAQFKAAQTRAENRDVKVKILNTSLAADDMRQGGTKKALLARIEEVKKGLA